MKTGNEARLSLGFSWLLSSVRWEDLTAHLLRGFPACWSTVMGRSKLPMVSIGQEDRLTRGASEDPTVHLASKRWKARIQGPCCSLASSQGWDCQGYCFPFLLSLAFVTGVKDPSVHIIATSFPRLFPVTLMVCCCFGFATEVVFSQGLQVEKDDNTKHRFTKSASVF